MKLAVPDVGIPAFLYLSSITLLQILASLLFGIEVIAVAGILYLREILAASMFDWVFPETETMYILR
jgi:hypothetical protein